MATIIRTDYTGAIHHAFGQGNGGSPVFLDDHDKRFFLGRLKKLKVKLRFKLYAYCVMTTHYHLLIETGPVPLEKIMGRLLSVYAIYFHSKYLTYGHVFEKPYKAKLVPRDAYFLAALRYIHLNPVEAGIVKRPEDWSWSGHLELINGSDGILDKEFPLSFFDVPGSLAADEYRQFVLGNDHAPYNPCFDRPVLSLSASLEVIANEIAIEHGIEASALRNGDRRRHIVKAKRALLRRAADAGFSQAEIASFLSCSPSAVSRLRWREVNR